MDDMQKVNQWFLDNEGISYEEFCKTYNNGEPLSDFKFLNIPEEIVELIYPRTIKVKDLPKDFLLFLENNSCLQNYLINVNNFIKRHEISIKDFLVRTNIPYRIDRSFRWIDTPEGHKFWSDLNSKYSRL